MLIAEEWQIEKYRHYLFRDRKDAAAKHAKGSTFLIALSDGTFLGSVMLFEPQIRGDFCILYSMSVRAPYKRMGIGEMLLDSFMAEAKRRGYNEVFLTTGTENLIAQRFYSKHHFLHLKTEDLQREYRNEIAAYRDKVMLPFSRKI